MQMLFIIPLLKTGNPYYIIVNILTDNGENTMQNEKTSVLVLAQCDLTMRETLNTRFGTQCAFTFVENGEHPTAEQLRAAAVIFGEPSEAQLAQTENLRLLQLTWCCTARLDGTGAINRRISRKNTTMRRRFPARPYLYSAWATSARMWPAD